MKRYIIEGVYTLVENKSKDTDELDVVKYDEANKLLIEAYGDIVLNRESYSNDTDNNYCTFCGQDHILNIPKHTKDCIVLKAEQYLKENKQTLEN